MTAREQLERLEARLIDQLLRMDDGDERADDVLERIAAVQVALLSIEEGRLP